MREKGFFTRSTVPHDSAAAAAAGGPYAQAFNNFSSNGGQPQQQQTPLSPPTSANSFAQPGQQQQYQPLQQQQGQPASAQYANQPSPYAPVNFAQPPGSPYERVNFAQGGVPRSAPAFYPPGQEQPPQQARAQSGSPYDTFAQPLPAHSLPLEESFSQLGFNPAVNPAPTSAGGSTAISNGAGSSSAGGTGTEAGYLNPASGVAEAGAQWGAWSGAGNVQA